MKSRLYLIGLFPLLVVDCLGNVVLKGSFKNTLSARAWHARNHKVWWWTHLVIDGIFWRQVQHCFKQAEREQVHGSVWNAWMADWARSNWRMST